MSTQGVSIRKAMLQDAEPIARLITELGYPVTPEVMRDRLLTLLPEPRRVTFIAEVEGQVVGVAGAGLDRSYEKDGFHARLLALAVSGPMRHRGIGSRLVEAAEAWARGLGAREILLNSGLHRREAHAFYEHHGYARTGLRFVKRLDGAAEGHAAS